MKTFLLLFSFIYLICLPSASAWSWPWETNYPDLKTVQNFDLVNFAGHWYEIARLPTSEETKCICAQQNLTLKDDIIIANNTCHKESSKGELSIALLKLWPKDKNDPSKLSVQHTWPFKGNYYVIDVADDYSWALVGEPNREHLWILSRKPKIGINVNNNLIIEAYQLNFPVEKLIYTEQNCGSSFE